MDEKKIRELMSQASPAVVNPTALGEAEAEFSVRPATDPSWILVEEGFSAAREGEIEALFTTANGFLGTRGSLAEGGTFSSPLTLMSGVFALPTAQNSVPELMPLPDWTHLQVSVGGHALDLERSGNLTHRRLLDFRHGILWREWRCHDGAGRVTRLLFLRLASLADRHILLQSVAITPENYSGRLILESRFSNPDPGGSLVATEQPTLLAREDSPTLTMLVSELGARGTGVAVALACANQLRQTRGTPRPPKFSRERDSSLLRWYLPVEIGASYRLDRVVYACSSRQVAEPSKIASARLSQMLARSSVKDIVTAHTQAWAERWQSADVEVEGAPDAQRAVRFAGYHLISAANPEDERASVGARGLSGQNYKGHVFWDTEIFLLPFYTFTHPASARALLMYRYHTLPAAREKARALGYRGALFAWESADDGRETTPTSVDAPDGSVIRIFSGEQEHHISADVAYAVWHYWQATGDDEFMMAAGAEILFETARFWASRSRLGTDGRYHIDQVVGPDEYHESVDDNAYTNVMAQWNLERAAELSARLEELWPARSRDVRERLQLAATEPEQWAAIARRMYIGLDTRTGLLEQFRGYFDLEHIDVAAYEPRSAPMDVLLGRERVQRSQVVKQADVVMLLALVWDRFTPEMRRENFRYYEPRTGHGSSLSPPIHALVAARLGEIRLAEHYFREAAAIDLADNMGNAAGGVHLATLGGLWQALVFGFAGMTLRPDGVVFTPRLPESWRRLRFPIRWRGRQLSIRLGRDALDIHMSGPEAMVVGLEGGNTVVLRPGQSCTLPLADEHKTRS